MCLIPLFLHDQKISCGKCPECLKAQRSDWAYRCEMEGRDHKYNYFFTLTFNEDNLPSNEKGVWDCFTAFRKAYWKVAGKFPYFVSMERGDLRGRLHLHMLMYSDKPVNKDLIRKLWYYGFIKRSGITPKRIKYALSYMFSPDMFNKVKMYRSSNGFGGNPKLPYRIRCKRGVPQAVPLPRYYCKKRLDAKEFARKYYDSLYHDNDFVFCYERCRERYQRLRSPYGQPRNKLSYEDYLLEFLKSRVRTYKTWKDPRDLIAYPGPDKYRGLNRTYSELLARVKPLLAFYGVRASGNLERYLTIDCPMSLVERRTKVLDGLKERCRSKKYIFWKDFFGIRLQLKFF